MNYPFSWAGVDSNSDGSPVDESLLPYFLLGRYTLMINKGFVAQISITLTLFSPSGSQGPSDSSLFCRIFPLRRSPLEGLLETQGNCHRQLCYGICVFGR